MREDKYIYQEGDVDTVMPQCKSCKHHIFKNGLNCLIKEEIDFQVRINKKKCEDFEIIEYK